ncbi:MAG TPA: xanthine dehydrogenase family protein molybdopterin-binding subunit [Alphaproteobacteria bacterium]|nr:xanthine dehydrogenase family protein molybdopterin-binding subunit [Alphaproteobacteria bacterium]
MLAKYLCKDSLSPTRRQFLAGAAGVGLTVAFRVPGVRAQGAAAAAPNPFNAYLRIAPDNTVTILSAHMDMGQGPYHGIATLVAEELDADWAQMRAQGIAGNTKLYGNIAWGGAAQGTGGSTAMASSFERYRRAGAIARAMLVSGASKTWSVPASEIRVEKGVLTHPSGRRATFGEMAEAAAREPMPADVQLKSPAHWTYIGSDSVKRIDTREKSSGRQDFTLDVRLPGMLTAVIAHPPKFGASARSFNAAAAKAVRGVVDVVPISRGVAVVADSTWAAIKGREALKIDWDESKAETRGTDALLAEYKALADRPGEHVAAERGDALAGLRGAARTIEATYEFPYLAHAAMEPLNAVARRSGDTIEVWGGHQIPDLYQAVAAKIAETTPDKVVLHVMKTGGGFGRRATPDSEIIVEAVETAKAIGWRAPVKVQWTREDDMQGGRYRPLMVHKVSVGLDGRGNIAGWHHRIVGQSILVGTPFESMLVKNGVDATSVEGVSDTLYAIAPFRTEVTNAKVGVPVLWWRSVGHTHTAYVMETMIDEIAAASGKDPVALRRELLRDHPRHLAVLNLAADRAGWGAPLPSGRFRGVALHESFATRVAQVAEISLDGSGGFKVERVVCAVDCGLAINPDVVRAQMEGGIAFGLSAAMAEAITLDSGRVEQSNYDSYTPLRIEQMPKVEVHIVPSTEPPTGVGEPGVPPIAPAVANAIAAATGQRIRSLPFAKTRIG